MSRRSTKSRWRKEVAVAGLVFALPLLVLCPYWPWRPPAAFAASIQSDAVSFTVGGDSAAHPFSAGLLNLTIEGADRIEGALASALACQTATVTQAQVQSLLLMPDTRVYVESGPGSGVRLQLQYPATLAQAPVQAFLTERSTVQCDGRAVPTDAQSPAEIRAFPRSSALAVGLVPTAPGGSPVRLSDAVVRTLQEGSSVTFLTARGNAIHEFAGNILTVGTASHQIQGLGSLELGKIGRNSAAEISATENGLSISLKGTAGVIQVDGSDARPSWAEALKARADVNAWLTTAILIGTTILTVLSRLKIVQLQEKS